MEQAQVESSNVPGRRVEECQPFKNHRPHAGTLQILPKWSADRPISRTAGAASRSGAPGTATIEQ